MTGETEHGYCGYPDGYCNGLCDVCGRHNAWGCGHSGSQRYAARRHNTTKAHQEERCYHYTETGDRTW